MRPMPRGNSVPEKPYMMFNIRLLRGPTSVYLNCLTDCTVCEVIK